MANTTRYLRNLKLPDGFTYKIQAESLHRVVSGVDFDWTVADQAKIPNVWNYKVGGTSYTGTLTPYYTETDPDTGAVYTFTTDGFYVNQDTGETLMAVQIDKTGDPDDDYAWVQVTPSPLVVGLKAEDPDGTTPTFQFATASNSSANKDLFEITNEYANLLDSIDTAYVEMDGKKGTLTRNDSGFAINWADGSSATLTQTRTADDELVYKMSVAPTNECSLKFYLKTPKMPDLDIESADHTKIYQFKAGGTEWLVAPDALNEFGWTLVNDLGERDLLYFYPVSERPAVFTDQSTTYEDWTKTATRTFECPVEIHQGGSGRYFRINYLDASGDEGLYEYYLINEGAGSFVYPGEIGGMHSHISIDTSGTTTILTVGTVEEGNIDQIKSVEVSFGSLKPNEAKTNCIYVEQLDDDWYAFASNGMEWAVLEQPLHIEEKKDLVHKCQDVTDTPRVEELMTVTITGYDSGYECYDCLIENPINPQPGIEFDAEVMRDDGTYGTFHMVYSDAFTDPCFISEEEITTGHKVALFPQSSYAQLGFTNDAGDSWIAYYGTSGLPTDPVVSGGPIKTFPSIPGTPELHPEDADAGQIYFIEDDDYDYWYTVVKDEVAGTIKWALLECRVHAPKLLEYRLWEEGTELVPDFFNNGPERGGLPPDKADLTKIYVACNFGAHADPGDRAPLEDKGTYLAFENGPDNLRFRYDGDAEIGYIWWTQEYPDTDQYLPDGSVSKEYASMWMHRGTGIIDPSSLQTALWYDRAIEDDGELCDGWIFYNCSENIFEDGTSSTGYSWSNGGTIESHQCAVVSDGEKWSVIEEHMPHASLGATTHSDGTPSCFITDEHTFEGLKYGADPSKPTAWFSNDVDDAEYVFNLYDEQMFKFVNADGSADKLTTMTYVSETSEVYFVSGSDDPSSVLAGTNENIAIVTDGSTGVWVYEGTVQKLDVWSKTTAVENTFKHVSKGDLYPEHADPHRLYTDGAGNFAFVAHDSNADDDKYLKWIKIEGTGGGGSEGVSLEYNAATYTLTMDFKLK